MCDKGYVCTCVCVGWKTVFWSGLSPLRMWDMQIELRVSGSKQWAILLPLLWPTLSFYWWLYMHSPNIKFAMKPCLKYPCHWHWKRSWFCTTSFCNPFSSLKYQGWFLSGRHQSTVCQEPLGVASRQWQSHFCSLGTDRTGQKGRLSFGFPSRLQRVWDGRPRWTKSSTT